MFGTKTTDSVNTKKTSHEVLIIIIIMNLDRQTEVQINRKSAVLNTFKENKRIFLQSDRQNVTEINMK